MASITIYHDGDLVEGVEPWDIWKGMVHSYQDHSDDYQPHFDHVYDGHVKFAAFVANRLQTAMKAENVSKKKVEKLEWLFNGLVNATTECGWYHEEDASQIVRMKQAIQEHGSKWNIWDYDNIPYDGDGPYRGQFVDMSLLFITDVSSHENYPGVRFTIGFRFTQTGSYRNPDVSLEFYIDGGFSDDYGEKLLDPFVEEYIIPFLVHSMKTMSRRLRNDQVKQED